MKHFCGLMRIIYSPSVHGAKPLSLSTMLIYDPQHFPFKFHSQGLPPCHTEPSEGLLNVQDGCAAGTWRHFWPAPPISCPFTQSQTGREKHDFPGKQAFFKRGSLHFVLVYLSIVQQCMVKSLKDECKSRLLNFCGELFALSSSADSRSFL